MLGDIKEIIGMLMRTIGGAEISPDEVMALSFDAEGELETALNAAYIGLLEFAHDRDARAKNLQLDRRMRAGLQDLLDRLVALADRQA